MITLEAAATKIGQCISAIGSDKILDGDIDDMDIDKMTAVTNKLIPEIVKLPSHEIEPLLVGLLTKGKSYEGFIYTIVADMAVDYPQVFDKLIFKNPTLKEMAAEYQEDFYPAL